MRRLVGAVLLVVPLLAGCSEGDPGADGDVESLGALVPGPLADELTESGRCDDGRLWAADDTGSLAVVVDPGDVDEATLPSEEVAVTVHASEPCEAGEGSPGVQGRVEVDRTGDCVAAVRIDGLEADDGTTFGPIEMEAPCD